MERHSYHQSLLHRKDQGLFQLFWEKALGLNWGRNVRHFGLFLDVFRSVNSNC